MNNINLKINIYLYIYYLIKIFFIVKQICSFLIPTLCSFNSKMVYELIIPRLVRLTEERLSRYSLALLYYILITITYILVCKFYLNNSFD